MDPVNRGPRDLVVQQNYRWSFFCNYIASFYKNHTLSSVLLCRTSRNTPPSIYSFLPKHALKYRKLLTSTWSWYIVNILASNRIFLVRFYIQFIVFIYVGKLWVIHFLNIYFIFPTSFFVNWDFQEFCQIMLKLEKKDF